MGCASVTAHDAPRVDPIDTIPVYAGYLPPMLQPALDRALDAPTEMIFEVIAEDSGQMDPGGPRDRVIAPLALRACPMEGATYMRIAASHCGDPSLPTLHTHLNAMCSPSRVDLMTQRMLRHRYDIIYCTKGSAGSFYFLNTNPLVR